MNRDIAQGEWKQMSGKIKQKWGKLTDDDLTRAAGDRDYLVGKVHEHYGIARDRVEDELQTLGYSEDDQDADLRSSHRSAAGRMDAAGYANASSPGRSSQQGGNLDREDPSGRSSSNFGTGSTSNRGNPGQKAGSSGSAQGDDMGEEHGQESPSEPRQPGGAGHTLEAGSAQGKSPQRSQPGQSGSSSKQSQGSGKEGQQRGSSGQGGSKR